MKYLGNISVEMDAVTKKYVDDKHTASAIVSALGNTAVNRATADANGSNIASTYLKKSGGTMTGNLIAPSIRANREMVLASGCMWDNISGSNVKIGIGTSTLFGNGLVISNPSTNNDQGWIRCLGTGESDTVLEIATGDDGGAGETIVFRGYNTSNAVAYQVNVPKTTGTIALTSDIPTTLPASDVYAWAKKSSLAASDVPTLNQDTTGSAGSAGRLFSQSIGNLNSPTWGAEGSLAYDTYTGSATNKPTSRDNANFVLTMNSGKHGTSGYYGWQISGQDADGALYARYFQAGTFYSWRQFAFTDGNVATATALATSRSIWGQSFNGSANVSGVLYNATALTLQGDLTDVWSDGTNTHPWYGLDMRNQNKGVYSLTLTDYYGMYLKTRTDGNGIIVFDTDKVGIGTTTPTQKLTVNGNTEIKGICHVGVATAADSFVQIQNSSDYQFYFGADANGQYLWNISSLPTRFVVGGTERMRITSDGNVGIKTTDPAYTLDVNGSAQATVFYFANTLAYGANPTNYFRMGRFDEDGGLKMQFGSTKGYFQLVNKAWNLALLNIDASGNLTASGNVAAYSSASDMRLKTITESSYDALGILNSLSTFKYKWNDQAKSIADIFKDDNEEHFGLSAQEIQKVRGYLVSKAINNEYYVLKKDELVPLLVRAIKQLTERVEELENR